MGHACHAHIALEEWGFNDKMHIQCTHVCRVIIRPTLCSCMQWCVVILLGKKEIEGKQQQKTHVHVSHSAWHLRENTQLY